jgi:lipopolysaccharide export system permease protein
MRPPRPYFTPTLYTKRLFVRTGLEICLLAALVEGLYLSERFISILKIVIDKPVGLENVLPLLAWSAPEVHLALPLAILVATYRVVLQYRENREFIALASGGMGTFPLMQFAGAVSIAAFVSSSLIAGELAPYAKFAFRDDIHSIQYQALRAGSTPGEFLFFPNLAIYVWPSGGGPTRPIFIKQILDDRTYRIVNSRNVELIDHSSQGLLVLDLLGVTMNDFPNQDERWTAAGPQADADNHDITCQACKPQFRSMFSDSIVKVVDLVKLVPSAPRGMTLDEWTTPELLGWVSPPGEQKLGVGDISEVMRRLARALLCCLMPFLAWVTLTFTTRRSQAFALPLACIGVMCADIVFSQLVAQLSTYGALVLSIILVSTACSLLALSISQIIFRQHLLIFPAMGRL